MSGAMGCMCGGGVECGGGVKCGGGDVMGCVVMSGVMGCWAV